MEMFIVPNLWIQSKCEHCLLMTRTGSQSTVKTLSVVRITSENRFRQKFRSEHVHARPSAGSHDPRSDKSV